MTFTENIYHQLTDLIYISTDEFSTEWLGTKQKLLLKQQSKRH